MSSRGALHRVCVAALVLTLTSSAAQGKDPVTGSIEIQVVDARQLVDSILLSGVRAQVRSAEPFEIHRFSANSHAISVSLRCSELGARYLGTELAMSRSVAIARFSVDSGLRPVRTSENRYDVSCALSPTLRRRIVVGRVSKSDVGDKVEANMRRLMLTSKQLVFDWTPNNEGDMRLSVAFGGIELGALIAFLANFERYTPSSLELITVRVTPNPIVAEALAYGTTSVAGLAVLRIHASEIK